MPNAVNKLFATQAWVYDALMDWDQRLAREALFFRQWCEQVRAKRVLDAACGSGRHAALLHGWGLQVEGADASPAMIAQAQQLWGEPVNLRWVVRGFDQPVDAPANFDLCFCIGNSLALAYDPIIMRRAIGCMLQSLVPGGLLVIQVLNLFRLPDGPVNWQKHKRITPPPSLIDDNAVAPGDWWISKGVHRNGQQGYVDVLAMNHAGECVLAQSHRFAGITAEFLIEAAQLGGAQNITITGQYDGQPYQPEQSTDLVLVAQR